MARDWSNEPYVRVYTRETDDDLVLSWEARAIWDRLITLFDRSGFYETKRGAIGIASRTRIPVEVVARALPELLADGRLVAVDGGYMAPNFIEAQSAVKSDRLRQKESRENRRLEKLGRPVTPREQTVTACDESVTPDRDDVTTGHEDRASVTGVTLSYPNQIDPDRSIPDRNKATPALSGGFVNDRQRLIFAAWKHAGDRHLALRGEGIDATAKPWVGMPIGEAAAELGARVRELLEVHGATAETAWATIDGVIEVRTAEARAQRSLRWFTPSLMFSSKGFWRSAEQSPEQASKPPRTPGAVGRVEPKSVDEYPEGDVPL